MRRLDPYGEIILAIGLTLLLCGLALLLVNLFPGLQEAA